MSFLNPTDGPASRPEGQLDFSGVGVRHLVPAMLSLVLGLVVTLFAYVRMTNYEAGRVRREFATDAHTSVGAIQDGLSLLLYRMNGSMNTTPGSVEDPAVRFAPERIGLVPGMLGTVQIDAAGDVDWVEPWSGGTHFDTAMVPDG